MTLNTKEKFKTHI